MFTFRKKDKSSRNRRMKIFCLHPARCRQHAVNRQRSPLVFQKQSLNKRLHEPFATEPICVWKPVPTLGCSFHVVRLHAKFSYKSDRSLSRDNSGNPFDFQHQLCSKRNRRTIKISESTTKGKKSRKSPQCQLESLCKASTTQGEDKFPLSMSCLEAKTPNLTVLRSAYPLDS